MLISLIDGNVGLHQVSGPALSPKQNQRITDNVSRLCAAIAQTDILVPVLYEPSAIDGPELVEGIRVQNPRKLDHINLPTFVVGDADGKDFSQRRAALAGTVLIRGFVYVTD
jgi:hypothetical protein